MTKWGLILRGSTLNATNMVVQVVVSFFMTPFILACLGEQLYGAWLLIAIFVGYYGLLDLGISSAVMRFVSRTIGAKQRGEIKYYVNSAFWVLSLLGGLIIIISVVVYFISGAFFELQKDYHIFRFSILVLGCGIGISFPFRIFVGVLNANLRFDLNRYVDIGQTLLRTAAIILLLKMGYAIYGLVLASVLVMLFDYVIRTYIAFKVDPDLKLDIVFFRKDKIMEMKSYSFFSFVQNLASIFNTKIDPYIIAGLGNLTLVTFYGIALSLVEYFSQFFYAVLGVLFPLISQKEGESDIESLGPSMEFITRITTITSTFLAAMVILYSSHFLVRWLGNNFTASYPYVVILFCPLSFFFGFLPCVFFLNSTGKHRLVAILGTLQGCIKLVLSLLLGFYYGGIGVALGTSISLMIFSGMIRPFFACRRLGVNPYVFWGKMIFTFCSSALLILPVWYFVGRNTSDTYSSLLRTVGFHLIFFVGIGPFLLLPKGDLKKIGFLLKDGILGSVK